MDSPDCELRPPSLALVCSLLSWFFSLAWHQRFPVLYFTSASFKLRQSCSWWNGFTQNFPAVAFKEQEDDGMRTCISRSLGLFTSRSNETMPSKVLAWGCGITLFPGELLPFSQEAFAGNCECYQTRWTGIQWDGSRLEVPLAVASSYVCMPRYNPGIMGSI